MAWTKQTTRKSTGGTTPRGELPTKPAAELAGSAAACRRSYWIIPNTARDNDTRTRRRRRATTTREPEPGDVDGQGDDRPHTRGIRGSRRRHPARGEGSKEGRAPLRTPPQEAYKHNAATRPTAKTVAAAPADPGRTMRRRQQNRAQQQTLPRSARWRRHRGLPAAPHATATRAVRQRQQN